MKVLKILLTVIIITGSVTVRAQDNTNQSDKKIVVVGSSVAAGWVTSYQDKYDFKNGYAYRLQRYLADEGFTVINKSIPGDNTKDVLKRFEKDILSEKPDYAIIGLSMSNEGLETGNPDSVYQSFRSGIFKIIEECTSNNIYPVLGLCYANNGYTALQYEYLKKMNIEMNSFGYPCINFLGVFDDGNGHFPGSWFFDAGHPDNRGHEEFFLGINPDLFSAIEAGKTIPELIKHDSYIKLKARESLYYFPKNLVHSFSFGFSFNKDSDGEIAQIRTRKGVKKLSVNPDGFLEYDGFGIPEAKLSGKTWHSLMITHSHLAKKTEIYCNSALVKVVGEQLESAAFSIGTDKKATLYRNLFVYRAALNDLEIAVLNDMLLHASLVCYAPFNKGETVNLAQTMTKVYLNPEDRDDLLDKRIKIIETAAIERKNELVIEEKQPIKLSHEQLKKFEGKYEIARDDYFTIEVTDDKIYLIDRGRKTEILPESENKFFIKFPGELTFTFALSENGKIESMTANFNGQKIKAIKVLD